MWGCRAAGRNAFRSRWWDRRTQRAVVLCFFCAVRVAGLPLNSKIRTSEMLPVGETTNSLAVPVATRGRLEVVSTTFNACLRDIFRAGKIDRLALS